MEDSPATLPTSGKNTNKIEDLRLVRIVDASLVPVELIEQIKNRTYTVQEFYDYQQKLCVIYDETGPRINPISHLYVLVDKDNKIKGVLWITLDGQECTVELFSIERSYWNKGKSIDFIHNKIIEIVIPLGIKKLRIFTPNPGAYEKIGFRRAKHVIMERELWAS